MPIRESRKVGMLMRRTWRAAVMCMLGRFSRQDLHRCTSAMMILTTERHGRCSSTLRGDCQHQQPDQKRSNKGHHSTTIAGAEARIGHMANGLVPVH